MYEARRGVENDGLNKRSVRESVENLNMRVFEHIRVQERTTAWPQYLSGVDLSLYLVMKYSINLRSLDVRVVHR